MALLTVDRLLTKALRIEKVWAVNRTNIAKFPPTVEIGLDANLYMSQICLKDSFAVSVVFR